MERDAVAARFEAVAAELELAAAHARTAAEHCLQERPARSRAHAFSVVGYLRKAQDELDALAKLHAERSVPVSDP